ncbi:MAG: tetratricopeptide repeat protein [Cyanobacteriota bacterium]
MVMNSKQLCPQMAHLGLKAVGCLLGLMLMAPAYADPPMTLLTGAQTVAQLKEDGAQYMQMGFHTLAINAYQGAIELEEKTLVLPSERDPDIPFNLGLIYARQGNLAKAQTAFQRAVEVDPSSFKARYQLALVHLKLGNQVAAKEQLTFLANAASGNPETRSHIESLLATLETVPLPHQEDDQKDENLARTAAVESEAAKLLLEPDKTETAALPDGIEQEIEQEVAPEKPRLSALQQLRQRELN